MHDESVFEFTELLIACHGIDAEKIARERARKWSDRSEPQWAELYGKVAEEIARRQPSLR